MKKETHYFNIKFRNEPDKNEVVVITFYGDTDKIDTCSYIINKNKIIKHPYQQYVYSVHHWQYTSDLIWEYITEEEAFLKLL